MLVEIETMLLFYQHAFILYSCWYLRQEGGIGDSFLGQTELSPIYVLYFILGLV